jgi:hypothetical protein
MPQTPFSQRDAAQPRSLPWSCGSAGARGRGGKNPCERIEGVRLAAFEPRGCARVRPQPPRDRVPAQLHPRAASLLHRARRRRSRRARRPRPASRPQAVPARERPAWTRVAVRPVQGQEMPEVRGGEPAPGEGERGVVVYCRAHVCARAARLTRRCGRKGPRSVCLYVCVSECVCVCVCVCGGGGGGGGGREAPLRRKVQLSARATAVCSTRRASPAERWRCLGGRGGGGGSGVSLCSQRK